MPPLALWARDIDAGPFMENRPMANAARATRVLDAISPTIRDAIRQQVPNRATRLCIGITGTGYRPNFQFDLDGTTLRYSSRTMTLLGSGSFNPKNIVEIAIR